MEKTMEEKTSASNFASFDATDTRVFLGNKLLDRICGMQIHINDCLSLENLCKTIPELGSCTLANAQNINAIVIFNAIVPNDYDIKAGSNLDIMFDNEYGSHHEIHIHDVIVIKRSITIDENAAGCIIEQFILVANKIEMGKGGK